MEYQLVNIVETLLCLMGGLALGSFITMASFRLPRGQEIIFNPSHCVNCNHKLSFYDLYPLFSWILQEGKCRYCKKPISIRYPIIEIIFGFITLFIYSKYGFNSYSLIILAVAICLYISIITDLEHYIIPDQIQIALIIISIFYNYLLNSINLNLLFTPIITCSTGIILRKIVYLWKKQDPLGFGDIKLLTIVGLYLPMHDLPVYFFLSGISGICTSIIWQILGKGKIFPFGPALAIAMFICIIFPQTNNIFTEIMLKFIFKINMD